jgi:uncharacterized RDD family membrane protein YckC
MENNPYAAPSAVVDDVPAFSGNDLEARKASRGQRLGAALLDGLIAGLCMAPVIVIGVMASRQGSAAGISATGGIFAVVGLVLLIALVVYNCILLSRNGQTIGKRTLNIKVVRTDGSQVPLSRFILMRWLPVTLLGVIPFIGRFIGLVDSCMIFGADKRCLHDRIADTIVIQD